ncbi:MAG: hypothetical protein Q9216_005699 [Gyalolechia sp. 2 TL-2023]
MHFSNTLAALFLLYITASFAAIIPVFTPNDEVAAPPDLSKLEDPKDSSNEELGLFWAAQRANKAVSGLHNKG